MNITELREKVNSLKISNFSEDEAVIYVALQHKTRGEIPDYQASERIKTAYQNLGVLTNLYA